MGALTNLLQFDDITMLCLELKENGAENGGTSAEEAL